MKNPMLAVFGAQSVAVLVILGLNNMLVPELHQVMAIGQAVLGLIR